MKFTFFEFALIWEQVEDVNIVIADNEGKGLEK